MKSAQRLIREIDDRTDHPDPKEVLNCPGCDTWWTQHLAIIESGHVHHITTKGKYSVEILCPNDCDTLVNFSDIGEDTPFNDWYHARLLEIYEGILDEAESVKSHAKEMGYTFE